MYDDSDGGDGHEGRFYLSGPLGQNLGLSLFGAINRSDRTVGVVARDGTISQQKQDVRRDNLGARLKWVLDDSQDVELEVVSNGIETRNATIDGEPTSSVKSDHFGASIGHRLAWCRDYETRSFIAY